MFYREFGKTNHVSLFFVYLTETAEQLFGVEPRSEADCEYLFELPKQKNRVNSENIYKKLAASMIY